MHGLRVASEYPCVHIVPPFRSTTPACPGLATPSRLPTSSTSKRISSPSYPRLSQADSRSSSAQHSPSSPRARRPTSLFRFRTPSYGLPLSSSGSPIATSHLSRAYATSTSRLTSWRRVRANGTSRCSPSCESGWPIRLCPGCCSRTPGAQRRVSCTRAPCAPLVIPRSDYAYVFAAEEARAMLQGVGSRFDFHVCKTLCDLR